MRRRKFQIMGIYAGAILVVLVMGFPLYWMVKTSIEPPTTLFSPHSQLKTIGFYCSKRIF